MEKQHYLFIFFLLSEYNLFRLPSSKWFLICDLKAGLLSGSDNIFYNFDVGSSKVHDKTFSGELNIKFSLRDEYLEYTIGLGYIHTNTLNLDNSIDKNLYRKINFSGFSIDLGISFVPAYMKIKI